MFFCNAEIDDHREIKEKSITVNGTKSTHVVSIQHIKTHTQVVINALLGEFSWRESMAKQFTPQRKH